MSEIRELAMRLAKDAGVDIASNGDCAERDVYEMYRAELESIVRAAMREAYARAAEISKGLHLNGRVTASGFVHIASADDCEKAIRAEADKLEGK